MGQETVYRKIKPRIESLSDMVFGLALSIGALALIAKIPTDANTLVTDVLYFAFSFLIVIMMWSGYTRTLAYLPIENESTFFLNVLLLFVVALEPFLFYVLVSTSVPSLFFLDVASAAYALDVGAMYGILAGFSWMVVTEEKERELSKALIKRFRRLTLLFGLVGAFFFVSALPIFWVVIAGSYLRFYFWYASFAIFFATRFANRGIAIDSSQKKQGVREGAR